jgi:hypothetical protein
MMTLPKTCHSSPWALIRRNGDTPGKRLSTRMAYLVDTIAPHGKAIAVTGYIMNNNMTGWTKHPRRIEWSDILKQWPIQPPVEVVRKFKACLPIAPLNQGDAA